MTGVDQHARRPCAGGELAVAVPARIGLRCPRPRPASPKCAAVPHEPDDRPDRDAVDGARVLGRQARRRRRSAARARPRRRASPSTSASGICSSTTAQIVASVSVSGAPSAMSRRICAWLATIDSARARSVTSRVVATMPPTDGSSVRSCTIASTSRYEPSATRSRNETGSVVARRRGARPSRRRPGRRRRGGRAPSGRSSSRRPRRSRTAAPPRGSSR